MRVANPNNGEVSRFIQADLVIPVILAQTALDSMDKTTAEKSSVVQVEQQYMIAAGAVVNATRRS